MVYEIKKGSERLASEAKKNTVLRCRVAEKKFQRSDMVAVCYRGGGGALLSADHWRGFGQSGKKFPPV